MTQKMQKRKMQMMPGFCGLLSLRRGRGYASSHLFLCSWAGIATARALRRRIGLVAGRHALRRPLVFYAWIHVTVATGANVSKLLGGKNPGWAKNMKKPTYGI